MTTNWVKEYKNRKIKKKVKKTLWTLWKTDEDVSFLWQIFLCSFHLICEASRDGGAAADRSCPRVLLFIIPAHVEEEQLMTEHALSVTRSHLTSCSCQSFYTVWMSLPWLKWGLRLLRMSWWTRLLVNTLIHVLTSFIIDRIENNSAAYFIQ